MRPIFIQEAETAWDTTTTPKTTASFNVQTGDVLVAYSVVEGYNPSFFPNSPTILDSSGMVWTLQQSIVILGYTQVFVWTTIVDSNKNITVSFTLVQSANSADFGGNVLTFRGSNGIGTASIANASGLPTLGITTTQDNSAIVVISADWNGADGASRMWLSSAGTFNETTYSYVTSLYTVYSGYHNDAGLAGLKTVGLQSPAAQKYSIAAIEVKGLTPTCPPLTCILTLSQ